MNNKSIISLISFLLVSMFYVASASAGPTYLNIEIPITCGKPHKLLSNQHCPLQRAINGNIQARNTTLVFKCVGGKTSLPVASFKTRKCGVVSVTVDSKLKNHYRWTRYAQVTTKNAACKRCSKGISAIESQKVTFDIKVIDPGCRGILDPAYKFCKIEDKYKN
jgi:hypothetical protein